MNSRFEKLRGESYEEVVKTLKILNTKHYMKNLIIS
jgi:hypothetical protein